MPVDQTLSPLKYNELIDKLVNPTPTYFSFQVDGVLFTVRTKIRDKALVISVVGELGFFPYTQESSARRRLITTIIQNTTLPLGKLIVEDKGRVFIRGELTANPGETPEEGFARFIIAVYKTHPFLPIIGALF